MKVSSEFSKYANHYDSYNFIQNKVANKLLSLVKGKPQYILDLGCGNGALANKIAWKYKKLIGVDFAPGMLEIHPKSKNIECIYGNFNDMTLFENLSMYSYDYILSSSALQWAEDIERVFSEIKKLHAPISLAIFTSKTFSSLYKTAGLEALLISKEQLDALQRRYFKANFEVVTYKMEFDSVRDMFRYIKRSGVSGSRNVLSYKEMKRVMKEYPHNYLEFEVAFISS
ncbi:methyltransferase domain-containing protein [Sulfurimonas sp.]|uniref:methyltransferase domain-containing protein n=1 Tax=Sulfurimonas sp. TaxID=2022749 RepID=UPI00262B1CD2|nr:methyltransferase domain-containing protein [Sulfurimonas sp.]